jgi:hypothetical protein
MLTELRAFARKGVTALLALILFFCGFGAGWFAKAAQALP